MDERAILNELVKMSSWLGKLENDFVILGEGNTSARIDDDFFFVKASGKYLALSDENTFVKVRLRDAQAILDAGEMNDDQIKNALFSVCADPANKMRPSVETTFHAFLLSLPGVNFVGHTHPTAVNSLMCSLGVEEILKGRIFPDEIVYCGIKPIFIHYTDPGLELARIIRDASYKFMDDEGCTPKVILVQNHGLIALGNNSHEVEAITAMWCKTCRVLAGTHAFGGPHFFTRENVERIYTRPDEDVRKQQFK